MGASLNIAALTKRTGLPPDTIRKWEQRYGVIQPERTAGGQRRYSELDVARIEWLKARLAEGYRIGEAAALLGSVDVGSPTSVADHRAALVDAVGRSDLTALTRLVDQALTLHPAETAFADILAPFLVEVGGRWKGGELSVAQEHLATGVVRGSLEKLLADVRPTVRGLAVLACAPGEQHEIGLLMLAVLLRADGWNVAYLGPNTPVADAVDLVRSLEATALCFSVHDPALGVALQEALSAETLPSGLVVSIGGRGAKGAPDMHTAVARLRAVAA